MNARISTISRTTSSTNGLTLLLFDDNIRPCCQTIKLHQMLKATFGDILYYTEQDLCADCVHSSSKAKIILIIASGLFPVDILRMTHELRQIDSIFIWTAGEQYDYSLDQYHKIAGMYSDYDNLVENIKENILLVEQDQQSQYYIYTDQKSIRDLTNESTLFIWFILIKDVITKMPRNEEAKSDAITECLKCYQKNNCQLQTIKHFNRIYCSDDIIKWYTRQTFVYKLINKALRTEDPEQIYTYRFLIAELHLRITQEYEKLRRESECTIVLYRGCKLLLHELEKLKENVNKLISINGFLSTSRSKNVALMFAGTSTETDTKQSVLFEIECSIDQLIDANDAVVFADIAAFSNYPEEEEVLFTCGNSFRIKAVNHSYEPNICMIKMEVAPEGVKLAKEYVNLNNKDFEEISVERRFGRLLTDMGQYEKALRYHQKLLINNQTSDLPAIYSSIGRIYHLTGVYNDALQNYKIAGQMLEEKQEGTSKRIQSARVFNNIGSVLYKMKKYDEASFHFEKGYQIQEEILGMFHRDTAQSLNNIGNVFFDKGDYDNALHYFTKSLEIRQHLFPIDHTEKAASLNSIGLVYWKQNRFDESLDFYLKSLNMYKTILPSEHDEIALLFMNLGNVLTSQHKFDEAYDYYIRSRQMRENLFPNGHPNLALTLWNIGSFFEKKHDYLESYGYYITALNMYKKFLHSEHPNFIKIEEDINRVKLFI